MSKILPVNPSLENLKKQAKTLHKAIQDGDHEAFARVRQYHQRFSAFTDADFANASFTLRDAQHVIAEEYGFSSWKKLADTVAFKRRFYTRFLSKLPPKTPSPANLFSQNIKLAMQHARRETERLRNDVIGTEHLLLGILKLGEGSGITTLIKLKVNLDTLQKHIAETAHPTNKKTSEIAFSSKAKKMLEWASEESKQCNHNEVGTGHLLLALARDPETSSAQTLSSFGIDYTTIKQIIESEE